MKQSIRHGLSFGLTSGIITTLGLIVGLDSATHSSQIVIGGILIIALADSLSDALGVHLAEESDIKNSHKKVWEATFSTFFFKFIIALSFIIPFLIFNVKISVIICVIYGMILLSGFSYYLAKREKKSAKGVILEHLTIAVLVIVATYFLGNLISMIFG